MHILVFGDSITQGCNDEISGGWCTLLSNFVLSKQIASNFEYNKLVFNLGVEGDTSEDLLKRVESEIKVRSSAGHTDEDVAILAIGVNDSQFSIDNHEYKIPIDDTIKNLRDIIDILKNYIKNIVLVGIAPVVDEKVFPMVWDKNQAFSNEDIGLYNSIIKSFSQENNLTVINMENVYGDDEENCLPDGIHPNAKGHRLIFDRVKTVLEKENIL